jgi:hypothetical protein
MAVREEGSCPPANLHEYQKKRVKKFAFCNRLILKRLFVGNQTGSTRDRESAIQEKREQAPALQAELSTGLSISYF